MNATAIVRAALAGSGIEAIASCGAPEYDAVAPPGYRSADWMPQGARGLVVAGSAGPDLWRGFMAAARADGAVWKAEHPYDTHVAGLLARADAALAEAGVRSVRFDAAFSAPVRIDFLALARVTGLGSPSPFRLHIHPTHGPWWALRGAWLVDAEVEPATLHRSPCLGCPMPCIGGEAHRGDIVSATPDVRARCVVGQEYRYDDDQIAYHYDRAATRARLEAERAAR